MTTVKSGTDVRFRTGQKLRRSGDESIRRLGEAALSAKEFAFVPNQKLPKRKAARKLKSETPASPGASPLGALILRYEEALAGSRDAGKTVSFRVDVDPHGKTVVTPLEKAAALPKRTTKKSAMPDPALPAALSAARARGRLRAAEIVNGDDMLGAEAFAKMLGTTRVTVNAKRIAGHILGLEGAKRGFRFPVWQLDAEGKPFTVLAKLHELLGGPWAVYRFLVQPHDELDGLTGHAALERGHIKTALAVAESIGRDFG